MTLNDAHTSEAALPVQAVRMAGAGVAGYEAQICRSAGTHFRCTVLRCGCPPGYPPATVLPDLVEECAVLGFIIP